MSRLKRSHAPVSQVAQSDLTKQVPGLLQGVDGASRVEVSLITGASSLEVTAEYPMDAAVVQVRQRAAALLLVSGSVHAMASASGALSVCSGATGAMDQQAGDEEDSEPWPMPVCHQGELQATVGCCTVCSLACSSAGASMF